MNWNTQLKRNNNENTRETVKSIGVRMAWFDECVRGKLKEKELERFKRHTNCGITRTVLYTDVEAKQIGKLKINF